jgi:hypothetical protein
MVTVAKNKTFEKELKNALRNVIRNHTTINGARNCKYCKDRMKLIENYAWDII